jgi:restriction system protein
VRSHHVGFNTLWLIECKQWRTRVTKLHVLALREIVTDLGADRGLLMAEQGFQQGAREAANLTNVRLTSLADLKITSSADICIMKIRDLQDRIDGCHERYWAIDKATRIEFGLRPDVGTVGYSTVQVVDTMRQFLSDAARGKYPATTEGLLSAVNPVLRVSASTPEEVIRAAAPIVADLEARLASTERAIEP